MTDTEIDVPGAFGAGLLRLTLIDSEGPGPDLQERRKLVEVSIVRGDPVMSFDRDALDRLITELSKLQVRL